jgi:hypothetical protein
MFENDNIVEEVALSAAQIAYSVKFLRSAFSVACNKYKQSNKGAVTYILRDLKTLKSVLPQDTNLTLYNAQIDFAHLLNDIERGPAILAAEEIKKAKELIDSLS